MSRLGNPKHERFAQEVAKGKPLVAAYEQAGYAADTGNAVRLSRLPSVRARIEEFVSAAAEDADISVKQIMLELARIGFADPRRAVEWTTVRLDDPKGRGAKNAGPMLATHVALRDDIDDDTAAAIAEIRPGPYGVTVRFHDKRGALVDLGKRFGMFREPKEGEGNVIVRIVKFSEQDFQKPDDDNGNV